MNKRPTTTAGIAQYTPVLTRDQVAHLLKRTMFGATKADVDFFVGMTAAQIMAVLLTSPPTPPSPPLNNYSTGDPTVWDVVVPLGQTWVNSGNDNFNDNRIASYKAWWIGQMYSQTRSMQEKMVLFWHNHFSTQAAPNSARYAYTHNVMLRRNALGNFRTFAKEVSVDPLMLVFLNGYLNQAGPDPDENYGRELQELFTVGKNADGASPFSEADVKAAAKVLTGYQIDAKNAKGIFTLSRHDTTDKQFSAFYSNTVIKGNPGSATASAGELDQLLDMIFATPNVAINIVQNIYRFFVYYVIDDTTFANVIQPLATIFQNSKYDIKTLLQTLFTSQHFFDASILGALIKSPIELSVSAVREFVGSFPPASNFQAQYNAWYQMYLVAQNLGQDLGDPPNVAGWLAYYQAPSYHELWINTVTLPQRFNFVKILLGTGYPAAPYHIFIAPISVASLFTDAADPNALVADLVTLAYRLPVTANFTATLKSALVGQVADHYWSDLWNKYIGQVAAGIEDQPTIALVTSKLNALFQFLLNQPEFQLS